LHVCDRRFALLRVGCFVKSVSARLFFFGSAYPATAFPEAGRAGAFGKESPPFGELPLRFSTVHQSIPTLSRTPPLLPLSPICAPKRRYLWLRLLTFSLSFRIFAHCGRGDFVNDSVMGLRRVFYLGIRRLFLPRKYFFYDTFFLPLRPPTLLEVTSIEPHPSYPALSTAASPELPLLAVPNSLLERLDSACYDLLVSLAPLSSIHEDGWPLHRLPSLFIGITLRR